MRIFHFAILISLALWNVSAQQRQPAISDIFEFDEYEELPFAEEKARLDNIVVEQKKHPGSVIFLMVYAARHGCRGQAQTHALRARRYVIKKHGIAPEQIVWLDGGYRERLLVVTWILPWEYPPPTPTGTIPKAEVKLRDCKSKGSKT
jgi:hypothetical protein